MSVFLFSRIRFMLENIHENMFEVVDLDHVM